MLERWTWAAAPRLFRTVEQRNEPEFGGKWAKIFPRMNIDKSSCGAKNGITISLRWLHQQQQLRAYFVNKSWAQLNLETTTKLITISVDTNRRNNWLIARAIKWAATSTKEMTFFSHESGAKSSGVNCENRGTILVSAARRSPKVRSNKIFSWNFNPTIRRSFS